MAAAKRAAGKDAIAPGTDGNVTRRISGRYECSLKGLSGFHASSRLKRREQGERVSIRYQIEYAFHKLCKQSTQQGTTSTTGIQETLVLMSTGAIRHVPQLQQRLVH